MSETKRVPDFSWITAAPIHVLRPDEVHAHLKAFRRNIKSWYGEASAKTQWTADPSATKDWNDRKEAMQQMIWWPFHDSDVVAEYRIDGAPVALIGLKKPGQANRATVHGLVCHPGAALGGATMIEWAVNFAKGNWNTINLNLHSLDDESTKFYKKIGFVVDDLVTKGGPDDLKLEPALSDKWIEFRSEWKLKEYAGLLYRGDHPS